MNILLQAASRAQQPLLAAMLPDYLGELGADIDYPYLPLYWREAGRYPYLIFNERQPVGFALVRMRDPEVREMAEFYVTRPWRKYGVGQSAARALFALHPGRWQLSVLADNPGALAFWLSLMPPDAYRAWIDTPGERPHWRLAFTPAG
ncbi:GNAT family N-acetyltransferase [Serratia ficaria]|uniref:GNAT family N-acetyltransferase n=1 Tax=Serratia ficaria TaxID=61651 RepID=UPI00077C6F01|nr:GNAT family N-acetyltransferase [Serratia ficaria]MEE4482139.1 GNAT family N-acetyltransferase [Serratia ficaria]CAI0709075.1 Predicted acetyltransferase [Serratia ficaria]CAI0798693.1 Predicted acetyltransferase [Serratia ficaria]CAI1231031.1 Predicted acetyltransferase [Serratia ficaria]CAI1663701.1 Predicted acetyltransferase [Serratia ficaria]